MAGAADASFVAGGISTLIHSDDGVNWSDGIGLDVPRVFSSAFGGGQWLGVGAAGAIANSTDGEHWSRQASGTKSDLNGVAYGNGLWVAVGAQGAILTSQGPPAWQWTPRDWTAHAYLGSNDQIVLKAVAFAGSPSQWVAVGMRGAILESGDGVNWQVEGAGVTANGLLGVAHGGGQWLAVGDSGTQLAGLPGPTGTILSSPDGISWTVQCSPGVGAGCKSLGPWRGVAYGGAQWVLVGNGGTVVTSQGPIAGAWAWTSRTSGSRETLYGIAYASGLWVAFGAPDFHYDGSPDGSGVFTSRDAVSWSRALPSSDQGFYTGAYGNGKWLLQAGAASSLDQGTTWTVHSVYAIAGIATGAHRWLALGGYHEALASSDGSDWTAARGVQTGGVLGAAYGNEKWVMVTPDAGVLNSRDGLDWTVSCPGGPACPMGTNTLKSNLQGVAYGAGRWVAFGGDPCTCNLKYAIWTSADGVAWDRDGVTFDGEPLYNGWFQTVAYGNGAWVAGSSGGAIFTSPDARSWTSVCAADCFQGQIRFLGGQWVAIGRNADVKVSPDGKEWTMVCPAGPGCLDAQLRYGDIAFDGHRFVAVTANPDNSGSLWSSGDLASWSKDRTFAANHRLRAVAADVASAPWCTVAAPALAGTPVALQGHEGSPPYVWDAPGSTEMSEDATSYSALYPTPGNYTVTIKDSGMPQQADTCTVHVQPVPPACAPATQRVISGEQVSFDVTGGVPGYVWMAPGAASPGPGTGDSFSTAYTAPGSYTVTFTDSQATPDSAMCQVDVGAPPAVPPPPPPPAPPPSPRASRPHAKASDPPGGLQEAPQTGMGAAVGPSPPVAGPNQAAEVPGVHDTPGIAQEAIAQPLSFIASPSGPAIGFQANRAEGSFGWDFGDASPVSSLAVPTHHYAQPGTYTVRLLYIDEDGHLDSTSHKVVVAATPATPTAKSISASDPRPSWGMAGLLGAVLVAGGFLVRYGWPHFLLAFFSRLRQSDLAKHPVRAAILDVAASQPGIQEPALARILGKARSTVAHHARILLSAGLLKETHWEGAKGYALASADRRRASTAAALRSANAQALLHHIHREPGLSFMDLVRCSGLKKPTVQYHVGRLQKAGLVKVRHTGPWVRIFGAQGSGHPAEGVAPE